MSTISANDSAALSFALSGGMSIEPTAANALPRLLLVDDEPKMLASLVALLEGRGYELCTATCGAEAVDQLASAGFDLALIDLNLPDFSGHEIMDYVNASGIDVKIIMLSGESGIGGPLGALKRGAYDYLRKPYPREELLKTIDNALGQRRLERENREIAWRLECSEKLYRYLVASSPDIIYTLDQEGRFTFINDRAQKLLGYAPGDLIGKHYSVLVHEDDLERARYVFNERRVGERASRNIELRLKTINRHERERFFDNTFMTISFNSTGMYSLGAEKHKREFFGTYGVARDITERKRAEELISHQAYHDILTDLPNRILFKDRLGLAVIQAKRNGSELAVMFIDLDRFKLVNDTLGHVRGDELLQQAAARLKDCLRRGDTLARLGGDEFTVVLPELRQRGDAEVIANKFLDCLRTPFLLDGTEVYISASIGIAVYPGDGETIEELLRHADIAMYHVKGQGKNWYSFYEGSMLDASYQKIELEQSLRRALEREELELYYQPQVDSLSGEITGVEALMRWNHPERGLLTAGEFLSCAEDNGLMVPISDWVLAELCRNLIEIKAAHVEPVQFSFNVSPSYLDRRDFFEKIRTTLSAYGVDPAQLEVEITENICIRSPQHASEQLGKLSQLGVNVAIDDFGTGYSSLSYLHRFPVDTIKIDQSFVRGIDSEEGHYPVVLAIISIARGLGLNIVAEGVENDVQARYLERNGCANMQGFHYYPPMPSRKLITLLHNKQALRAGMACRGAV
jgi:diguanylate cyclase (GGDEF)-like protein/PAS domain S-box-containing protein